MQWNDKIQWTQDSLFFLKPELILAAGLILLMLLSFRKKTSFLSLRVVTTLLLLIAFLAIVLEWPTRAVVLMSGMLRSDDFSATFKILILSGGLLTVWMGRSSARPFFKAEYFMLILSVCLGSALLTMSMNLLMMILSLELISIASYVLATYRLDRHSAESSLKYFLFGAVMTGVALFGMSLLFGVTGSLDFASKAFTEGLLNHPTPASIIGGVMVMAALLFKISAVPFHWWAPDVYEASPTPVVALFSVVPKVAGIAAIVKFSLALHLFGQSAVSWQWIIGSSAIFTIIAGNLAALGQQHVRRLMAYSSISQAGFLLAGVATFSPEGLRQCVFYAATLLCSNYLVFGMLDHFEERYGMTHLKDFSGQGGKNWPAGIMLTLGLISLVGLPPAGGFMAKLLVFASLFDGYQEGGNSILLVLLFVALMGTAISLFFYLKIPFALYVQPARPEGTGISKPMSYGILAGILSLLLLILFFNPSLLTQWLNRINFAF